MRQLTDREIAALAGRAKVRRIAVENFLGTMGEDRMAAHGNLALDAGLYGWNAATVAAINKGIELACSKFVCTECARTFDDERDALDHTHLLPSDDEADKRF